VIYLDYAATTAPDTAVIKAVSGAMETLTANPSSAYGIATPCRAEIRRVKTLLAEMIGASPQEIYFTSGGTESNNWAIFQSVGLGQQGEQPSGQQEEQHRGQPRGQQEEQRGGQPSGQQEEKQNGHMSGQYDEQQGRKSSGQQYGQHSVQQARQQKQHVVISAAEHKSVIEAAKDYNCDITLVNPESNGIINPEDIKRAIRPDTALVSVGYANNETGVIQNISEIGELVRKKKILFHTDAVAAFGHIPINVKNTDMLSVSAHKLYGPRGIGFLYIRQYTKIKPLISGGGQEQGRRGGTENIPAIAGFGAAAALAVECMSTEYERISRFHTLFCETVMKKSPAIREIAASVNRLPGIISLFLPGLDSEIAVAKLDSRGVYVSGGAACNSDSHEPSAVLLSMGMDRKAASDVIRVSLGRHTTEEEIVPAAPIISEVYEQNKKGC
jgi:cysteine desulfurase